MNDEYKSMYKMVDALRFKFRDYVDQPNDPVAAELYKGIEQLAEDFEMSKNPHMLEDMAKRLIEDVHHINNQPTIIMDPRHLNDLRERLENIRSELRKFSNY